MRIAVFDLEIKTPIEKCSQGWNSHNEMGISCLCLFDYYTNRFRVFDDRSQIECLEILNTYDYVVGFNTVNFDWKVVNATWKSKIERKSRDIDILREIWISLDLNPDVFNYKTHGGYKLDDVAWESIALRKTGDGAHAPILYQEGRFAELVDYCLEDVRIEKTLFEFAANIGYVVRNDQVIKLEIPQEIKDYLKGRH